MGYKFKSDTFIFGGSQKQGMIPSTRPENPEKGYFILNENTNALEYYNGTEWITLDNNSAKRIVILTIGHNATLHDGWLDYLANVPSNLTAWSPPFDCQIMSVNFSNKNYGSSSNPMISQIKAYYEDLQSDGSITTNSSTEWYVNNYSSSNLISSPKGQNWKYDNSSENDVMYANKRYGFRFQKIDGNGNPHDIQVTIVFREI